MELAITAQIRTALGRHNSKLRQQGLLPAVLYGSASAKVSPFVKTSEDRPAGTRSNSVNLQVSAKEFDKIYRQAGENTLIDLVVDGKGQHKVLIHDVAKHYMKDEAIHVDFYEVDLTRKIHAKVPLEFAGVSPAVKESGGILLKVMNEIEVESLPADLPHKIEIDLGSLKTFEDAIRLSDIKLSGKVKILGNPDDTVASVQAPRTEEDLAALEQPTAEAEKAAVEALTKEPEVTAEGEAEAVAEGPAKPVKAEVKKSEEKPQKK